MSAGYANIRVTQTLALILHAYIYTYISGDNNIELISMSY